MFKRLLLIGLFATVSLAFCCEAKAHNWFDCGHQRTERALYNANVLAYKQRYTQWWIDNYRRAHGIGYGQPVQTYRTPQVQYYRPAPIPYSTTPSAYGRTVIHGY